VGAWGNGILDSDEARDVYALWFHHYDRGATPEEASRKVLERHAPEPGEPVAIDDVPLWLALAHAQWECRALDAAVRGKVEALTRDETEKPLWEGGWPGRRAVLRSFVRKLARPPARARRRARTRLVEPPFPVGTCIGFARGRGRWGAAVVLDGAAYDRPREFASMLIAVTGMNQARMPTPAQVARARVRSLFIESFSAAELSKEKRLLAGWKPVGVLAVARRFEPFLYGMTVGWDLARRADGATGAGMPSLTVAELIDRPADPALARLGELFVGSGFRDSDEPEIRHRVAAAERRRYVQHLVDQGWIAAGRPFAEICATPRWRELIAFLERYTGYAEGPHPRDGLSAPVRRVLRDGELDD